MRCSVTGFFGEQRRGQRRQRRILRPVSADLPVEGRSARDYELVHIFKAFSLSAISFQLTLLLTHQQLAFVGFKRRVLAGLCPHA